MDLEFEVQPGMYVELDDGVIVLVVEHRANRRVRVRRGEHSFSVGLCEITKIIHDEPLSFWETFESRLKQEQVPTDIGALVAAAKVAGKNRPLFTWGTVDATPYLFQYTPLFALRSSPWGRILVADETGLGKTIEAGIVIMELLEADESNGGIRDALVIGPINLLGEWKRELQDRFGLKIERISTQDLLERLEGKRQPSKEGEIHYLSMDALPSFVKKTALKPSTVPLDRLYDLVVVDEAHHFKSEGVQRSRGLKILLGDPFPQDQEEQLRPIPKLMLLTATPLSTHLDNLQSYFTYMDPALSQVGGMEVRKEAFREEHRRVVHARKIAQLAIQLLDDPTNTDLPSRIRDELSEIQPIEESEEEEGDRELQAAKTEIESFLRDPSIQDPTVLAESLLSIDPWSNQIVRNTRRGTGMHGNVRVHVENLAVDLHPTELEIVNSAPWLLHDHPFGQLSIRQQLSSSVPAYLFRHLLGVINLDESKEMFLESESEGLDRRLSPEGAIHSKILKKVRQIPKDKNDLIRFSDGKFDRLLIALKSFFMDRDQLGALLFTRYTSTAEYLRQRLLISASDLADLQIFHIHGGVPHEARNKIIEEAKTCTSKFLMILTEVGQEGVNLQFATGVFHYDLPWNPMRIIQRNGRVNRIGQKAKDIYLYTFYVNDTLDDDISRAIAERMHMVCMTFGDIPEGLVGLDPGMELSRIIGDRVKLEVYSGLRGIPTGESLDSSLTQDAEELRRQTRQIQIHKDQIEKLIGEDAESCRAWYPLLRESLYGSWGSMERVLKRDLVALLKWAGSQPKIGMSVSPEDDSKDSWSIQLGPYRISIPPSSKIARSWRSIEKAGDFQGFLLPDEGGRRPDVDSAKILHLDHPMIRDLADRALKFMAPPMAISINPALKNAHCLISLVFTLEEENRKWNETRWFLLERKVDHWYCHPSQGSDKLLEFVLSETSTWKPLPENISTGIVPDLISAIHDIQDQVEIDILKQRQRHTVRMGHRSVLLWRSAVKHWQIQVDEAKIALNSLKWILSVNPEQALVDARITLSETETIAQATAKLLQKANRLLSKRVSFLKRAEERIASEKTLIAKAQAGLPSGIRVVVQDGKPNAAIFILPEWKDGSCPI